ncbi:MAG: glycosyltransferase family 4 protein [Prevotellaceae bacterium]|nr:glycosyltransferase family 4 protein [Candidatus Colivivens equi]
MKRNSRKIIRAVTVSQSIGFCREVMIKMRERGYEMIVVTSKGRELDELRDVDGFRCLEVEMERHISPIKDFVALMKMISVFWRERPQMVHSMTPKAGLLCMMAAWLTRVPVRIHTFTGLVWPTEEGMKRRVLMFTDWLTCACATHVIPEGRGVMDDLKKGGITHKPMKVLGYGNVMGIDLERFCGKGIVVNRVKRGGKCRNFLFVGRIVGDKGINELVRAVVRLHDVLPDVKLRLVGNYEWNLDPLDSDTMKVIEDEIRKDESVRFIDVCGGKYGDDLICEYKWADCFVMPSYREGFPNTVIEAGAMDLPCVVTDINGSREIIEDGVNGLIVAPKDENGLFDAMKRMAEDDELRYKMVQNARTMIASRFEKNFVQGRLMEFYQTILPKESRLS